ncbi:hypothetical protein AGABI2DRAFT_132581 [Agaricus bisporus var. bisporus H97]|uniref:hypothetical protein n=1 Tax=Agaricus bisporus var. bisporus (strain H97 / ATCC MYA-4626 / FGSC 10389) TaxID=936046 RepID=UPI00029F6A81|nr:hypothetical protein AGABI2DRAFT_132581 [Agaricus bisporus var. bisporus H97]EKV50832.1 hypothetical protein AGABI2DRAFT_132581 [Agaricus bisporus var. bisporus H97]
MFGHVTESHECVKSTVYFAGERDLGWLNKVEKGMLGINQSIYPVEILRAGRKIVLNT